MSLAVQEVPIDQLHPPPWAETRAIREEDLTRLAESLEADPDFLWARPILAREDGMIYAGLQRWRAAQALGLSTVPVLAQDISLQQAQERHLRDNNHWGTWRDQPLAELLGQLHEADSALDLLGFDDRALQQLLDRLAPADPLTDPDRIPTPAAAIAQHGDCYQLGPHRLVCGDARSPAVLRRLCAEAQPVLLVSDPPYGVDYVGKTADQLTIANDGVDGLAALLAQAFAAVDPVLAPGAALYLAHPAGPLGLTFAQAFIAQGWELRQTLVWVKDQFVLGHSDYHYQHEPILFGYKPGGGRRGRGHAGWYGNDATASVFFVPRPQASPDHPTTKPVELIAAWLRHSSRTGEIVCDPFLGSGTTLIAAEQTGRICYGVEWDPRYVDVAVRRWEEATGQHAARESAADAEPTEPAS